MPEPTIETAGVLARTEHYIYLIAGLLVTAAVEMVQMFLNQQYVRAMVHLLDRVLQALMLAEIIYTVERIARTRRLEATPLLMVGIIAAVRRMLIITTESVDHASVTAPQFQAAILELTLLSMIIVLLAWAMRVVPGDKATLE
jgi:uncharacterized membrane protein (DUF373 family)